MKNIKLLKLQMDTKLLILLTEKDIKTLQLIEEVDEEKKKIMEEFLFAPNPFYHDSFEGVVIFELTSHDGKYKHKIIQEGVKLLPFIRFLLDTVIKLLSSKEKIQPLQYSTSEIIDETDTLDSKLKIERINNDILKILFYDQGTNYIHEEEAKKFPIYSLDNNNPYFNYYFYITTSNWIFESLKLTNNFLNQVEIAYKKYYSEIIKEIKDFEIINENLKKINMLLNKKKDVILNKN